jgi:outer membrane receptor protein involved in Fe transport
MKVRLIIAALLFGFIAVQVACSSTSNTVDSPAGQQYGYMNILEMLRKEPQLMISGPTTNPEIRVRGGGRSIAGSNEPLFVVDGSPVGQGYNTIRSIDVNLVESINVVSPARAGKYGARGSMGVIEIRTRIQ